MPITGDVEVTIIDNGGAISVPSQEVQVVIGTSSAGSAAQVVATRNPNTVASTFGYGPMPEAAALAIAKGATVLCLKAASNTPGAATAVVFTGTGSSIITVTGTPNDSYLVRFLVTTGGTVGTTGIRFQISLDGGKSYGPVLALNTATTYLIPNTGITLNFAAGTLVAGDKAQFSTTEPLWNTAGVQACINALASSSYGLQGWGSMHITGPMSGANATTINGYVNTLATSNKIYTRAIANAVDVTIPAAWGGAGGQTEAQWITAISADYAAVDAKRMAVCAGHYNMPSALPNPAAGLPRYRRPLSFALAARQVTIPPQRHAGRVRDGALADVVVDATNDPTDGFVYHDERQNPGLDAARFASARSRVKKQGFYIHQPRLMSATGSVFELLPHGNVMDVACGIVADLGQDLINEDLRLNKNGTIFENEARTVEKTLGQAIADNMLAKNMISDYTVSVERTNNVQSTSEVIIYVTIYRRGYVLSESVVIGFGTAATTSIGV